VLDVSRLHALGWKHSIELRDGVERTYRWFCDNVESLRGLEAAP
jgi:GDP-L-fucose synthase